MPTVIFMDDSVAVVECIYVPSAGQTELQAADSIEESICRPKCGIWRDAALRHQEKYNMSGGKEDFKLMCLHPTSPYLAELKKKVKETGTIYPETKKEGK